MTGVGCGHSRVIAAAGIRRSVIARGECRPVFITQIFVVAEMLDESSEKFELFEFGTAHAFDKFVYILASAYLPVESPDLEHSPEGAFYCRYFVDGTCLSLIHI